MFQILQHGGLPKLMELVRSSSSEEAAKALYAVSAIIRNFPLGQEAFYLEGGATLLEVHLLSLLLGRRCNIVVGVVADTVLIHKLFTDFILSDMFL